MAEKVLMLALSPTMENGTILKWNKKEGDVIVHNEVLCEVETDKSSMDYESMYEGTILKIVTQEGESAIIGQAIAIVGKAGEDVSALLAEIASEDSAREGSETKGSETKGSETKGSETKGSETNGSETNGSETKEVDTAVASPTANTDANTVSSLASSPTSSPTAAIVQTNNTSTGGRLLASPLAKKLAASKGINIAQIAGSGPHGRIVKRDVENAQATGLGSGVSSTVFQDSIVPVKGVRAVIAKRLSESKFSAPHFYIKNTVRTEQMMQLRGTLNAGAKEKMSLNAFLIKFVAEAIKQYPEINSSWQGDSIVQYGSIDIALAVDLGNGLFTPVVRNCGNKGIHTIDTELKALIEKVRDRSISAEEYNGATFTISNLGSFGVDEFTAIINPPGACILAIGRGRAVPVVSDKGTIEVGNVMSISLSSDHRVIDGSLAGRFVARLQAIIENPGVALL